MVKTTEIRSAIVPNNSPLPLYNELYPSRLNPDLRKRVDTFLTASSTSVLLQGRLFEVAPVPTAWSSQSTGTSTTRADVFIDPAYPLGPDYGYGPNKSPGFARAFDATKECLTDFDAAFSDGEMAIEWEHQAGTQLSILGRHATGAGRIMVRFGNASCVIGAYGPLSGSGTVGGSLEQYVFPIPAPTVGEIITARVRMVGNKVSVWLRDVLIVEDQVMTNTFASQTRWGVHWNSSAAKLLAVLAGASA